jgi:energy-coupling factor transporter transmembrane protein EcfT
MSSPGPLSLLAACLLPVLGAFAVDSARVGLWGVGVELVALGWLARDPRRSVKLLAFGILAAISIFVSTYLYGGRHLDESAAAALRIVYIVLPAALLTPVIQPAELGDHLAQRLHLPGRPVVAAVVALQRIESIGEQWRQVQQARRARGLGPDNGVVRRFTGLASTAFAVLVVSMRHTASTAVAMDARGFAAATQRTWAGPAPWGWSDSIVLGLGLGLSLFPWFLFPLLF